MRLMTTRNHIRTALGMQPLTHGDVFMEDLFHVGPDPLDKVAADAIEKGARILLGAVMAKLVKNIVK